MAPQQHHPGRALVRRGALYCCATRCGCERVRAARSCECVCIFVSRGWQTDLIGLEARSEVLGEAQQQLVRLDHVVAFGRRVAQLDDLDLRLNAMDNIAVDCLTSFGRRVAFADFGASARCWSCSAAPTRLRCARICRMVLT
jgi:hypothetical protein